MQVDWHPSASATPSPSAGGEQQGAPTLVTHSDPTRPAESASDGGPLPAIYLGHGAPPLLEDPLWMAELGDWAQAMTRPSSIIIVSAHWQSAPMAISATERVPLVYDFYGFPEHYYRMTYDAPGAPELAARVRGLGLPKSAVLTSWQVSFAGASTGVYTYICQIHEGMEATITVH